MRVTMLVLLTLGAGAVARAEVDAKAVRLWKAKCASCHGDDGKAQTVQGKKLGVSDLTTAEWQKRFTDAQLKLATEAGVHRLTNGVKQDMDGYKDKLKPEQIDALVVYMRQLASH